MVFEHRISGGRAISQDQEALIRKALDGGQISAAEAGALLAVEQYADPIKAAQARQALKTAKRAKS